MTPEIVTMAVAELKAAPYNPRKITPKALSGLKASIERFGMVEPVVWNKRTGHLVGGHQRVQALLETHAVETPVVVVDLPEAEEKILNVTLNNRAIAGDWTEDALDVVSESLAFLSSQESAALCLGDLEKELSELFGKKQEIVEDEVPEAPKVAVTKTGDLWTLGRHRLLCGDATKAGDVGVVLAGAEPFLMVTDPPYGVEYDPDWRNRANRANGRPYGASAVGLVSNDDRADWSPVYALFPGGVAYVWHPAGARQVEFYASLVAAGFVVRMQMIWAKSNFPIGRGNYHVQHEPCWYAVRKGVNANWGGDRTQSTLWQIPKPHKSETGHSTQKPVECMARPIRNHDAPEVYDPFLGSGTALIAAEQLDRRCFGLEIEPAYCDVIVERWQNLTGGKAERVSA